MQRRCSLVVLLAIATACSAGQIAPAEVDVPDTFVGGHKVVPLTFTVNGKAVTGAHFSIGEESTIFDVVQVGPLGAPPQLIFRPSEVGPKMGLLQIDYAGNTYDVPIKGTGLMPPECPPPTDCMTFSQNFDTGECVSTNARDGTACNLAVCTVDSVCHSGLCSAPPSAGDSFCEDNNTDIKVPAWTYAGRGQIVFNGTLDADGNLYALDCDEICDVVSLTFDGQLRWRYAGVIVPATSPSARQLMVSGDHVLLLAQNGGARAVTSLRRSDRQLEWSRSVGAFANAVGLPCGQLALLVLAQDGSTALEIIDPATGAPSKSIPLGSLTSLESPIGDGQGTVFVLDDQGGLIRVDTGTEAVTSLAAPSSADGINRLMGVWGDKLFASPAALLSAATGDVVNLLPVVEQVDSLAMASDGTLWAEMKYAHPRSASCARERVASFSADGSTNQWACVLPENTTSVVLTEGNGVAFASFAAPPRFTALGADGQRLASFILNEIPMGRTVVGDTAVLAAYGQRWFVAPNGTGTSGLAAFDIPDVAVAPHGWIGLGGNPSQDGTPR